MKVKVEDQLMVTEVHTVVLRFMTEEKLQVV